MKRFSLEQKKNINDRTKSEACTVLFSIVRFLATPHQVGMQVHGRPLNPPNIIFWNVRADTFGYPAAADQKGVMLLSL